MPNAVDGRTKNQIFQTLVTMSGHHHQVGLHLFGYLDDFVARTAPEYHSEFRSDSIFLQPLGDVAKIALASLDLRSRGAGAEQLAGGVLLYMQQVDDGAMLARHGCRMGDGRVVIWGMVERHQNDAIRRSLDHVHRLRDLLRHVTFRRGKRHVTE